MKWFCLTSNYRFLMDSSKLEAQALTLGSAAKQGRYNVGSTSILHSYNAAF
jgi:hypothetical protein